MAKTTAGSIMATKAMATAAAAAATSNVDTASANANVASPKCYDAATYAYPATICYSTAAEEIPKV